MTYACAKACISLRSVLGYAMAECVVGGEKSASKIFVYLQFKTSHD